MFRYRTYLPLYELFCLIIQDGAEAMLVHRGMRIQTEVNADVNGRQFIPKLPLSLQQRERDNYVSNLRKGKMTSSIESMYKKMVLQNQLQML